MSCIQFYLVLEGTDPSVWRRILVPYEYTFYQFHLAIQGAFGWENYHLFQFSRNGLMDEVHYAELVKDENLGDGLIIKDAKRNRIKKVFGQKDKEFVYVYDFGDNWVHRIVVEKFDDKEIDRPYCIDGSGACPPEDCGGVHEYFNLVNILNSPGHPERENYIECLGLEPNEAWDANLCSIREVNKRLSLLG